MSRTDHRIFILLRDASGGDLHQTLSLMQEKELAMVWIALTFAGLVILGGLLVAVAPRRTAEVIRGMLHWPMWLGLAVVSRVAAGSAFLMVAPSARLPDVTAVLGVVLIAAGASLAVAGRERAHRCALFFIEHTVAVRRSLGIALAGVGVLLGLTVWPI